MCINWKVVAGLAAAGLGVYAFAPNLIGAALPILVLAACPLSMVVMMRAMSGRGSCDTQKVASEGGAATAASQDELAELRAEVAQLRAERSGPDELPRDRSANLT